MAKTFNTLPGVTQKIDYAKSIGFNPGNPLEAEVYTRDNHSEQTFERGKCEVVKYHRNFNGTPIDEAEAGGSGPFWDVNFYPDAEDLIARFTLA